MICLGVGVKVGTVEKGTGTVSEAAWRSAPVGQGHHCWGEKENMRIDGGDRVGTNWMSLKNAVVCGQSPIRPNKQDDP